MEKEMLSIVATLEEFRGMLLGAKIHIWTDYTNLCFNNDIKTQRVLHFCVKVEEFLLCVHDKGGKFIGREFHGLMERFSVKDVCFTSKNPQSDAICERMHQTVENVLRILVHANPPKNMSEAKDIVDDALATAMLRATVATTLGSAPGALAFSSDMFLNVPLITD
jgi:hypothetical protein